MTVPVPAFELLSEHACFGGVQCFYQHASTTIGLPTYSSVYLPPQALAGTSCLALFYLADLTCMEGTFVIKAGAQRVAARGGSILIGPDISPRGANAPGETDSWNLSIAAGLYLDATQVSWREHYRMESYIADELHHIARAVFPVTVGRIGIFGHSTGGHSVLALVLYHREYFASVSAFVLIAHPSVCLWGIKAFTGYPGDDRIAWAAHDATQLVQQAPCPLPRGILVDQGEADKFLAERLYPDDFAAACVAVGQPLQLRRHPGYDHGYYFIETLVEDHLSHHVVQLCQWQVSARLTVTTTAAAARDPAGVATTCPATDTARAGNAAGTSVITAARCAHQTARARSAYPHPARTAVGRATGRIVRTPVVAVAGTRARRCVVGASLLVGGTAIVGGVPPAVRRTVVDGDAPPARDGRVGAGTVGGGYAVAARRVTGLGRPRLGTSRRGTAGQRQHDNKRRCTEIRHGWLLEAEDVSLQLSKARSTVTRRHRRTH